MKYKAPVSSIKGAAGTALRKAPVLAINKWAVQMGHLKGQQELQVTKKYQEVF